MTYIYIYIFFFFGGGVFWDLGYFTGFVFFCFIRALSVVLFFSLVFQYFFVLYNKGIQRLVLLQGISFLKFVFLDFLWSVWVCQREEKTQTCEKTCVPGGSSLLRPGEVISCGGEKSNSEMSIKESQSVDDQYVHLIFLETALKSTSREKETNNFTGSPNI